MITVIAALLSAPLLAGHPELPQYVDVQAEELQWVDSKDLPAGAKVAVVYGNPALAEPIVIRVRLPADYTIMPHSHGPTEYGTILSGRLLMGRGLTFAMDSMTEHGAGDFFFLRGGAFHFVHTIEPVEIELHGVGPWSTTYANAADDPRT